MKSFILLSLFLSSIVSFGQALKTTTLSLSTGDCRRNESYSPHGPKTITFYKLPEDTIIYKITPKNHTHWPIEIENAPTGNYKLVYTNNYNQPVTEHITLTEQDSNDITICPDKLPGYPQNTLALLQDKDTLSINFSSQGCFHADAFRLVITREKDQLIARVYNMRPTYSRKKGEIKMQQNAGNMLKAVTMNSQHIQDFIRFENELNYARDGGCTTTDGYEVRSKYLDIKKTDGTCSWNGFYYLVKSLFGENWQ